MKGEAIFLAVICTTLLILLLVAVIVIVFVISTKERVKQQMQLTKHKLSFERELREVEAEVGEQLMRQFAQELHDNVGQLLTAMHIQIENQKIDHPKLAEGFKPVEVYLAEVTQQLRILSRTFNHDYLWKINLFDAIQLETERLNALKKIQLHLALVGEKSNLDKNQELMLFRIFQEITQNTLKHSAAKNLYVEMKNESEGFEFTVKDDGKGFNTQDILKSSKASGLMNIQKRAMLAGFTCKIQSDPGNGCQISLKKNNA
jgi:two-component system NarL family sensor kinase